MSKELIERLRRIEAEEREMGRRHIADLLDECRGALIAQEPLTDQQIKYEWHGFNEPTDNPVSLCDFEYVARAIERAHRIGEQQ